MSTPDLHTRAARFFLLAEQASRLGWFTKMMFWGMSTLSGEGRATHLPALAATIARETDGDVLWELARYPLPNLLPPEAVPWHQSFVADQELPMTSSPTQLLKRLMLLRLDGCGMPAGMKRFSHLPEWMDEARRTAEKSGRNDLEKFERQQALAALAAWRPAPRVLTAPETLREWVAFWQKMRQSHDLLLKGIAAKAMLNLPEADLRAASIPALPTGQLLLELALAIPVAAEKTRSHYSNHLRLLEWQPQRGMKLPAAELTQVAQAWLNVTLHNRATCRQTAWRQLIRWDRGGWLKGKKVALLPFVVEAVPMQWDGDVVVELAQWAPDAGRLGTLRSGPAIPLLQQLEAGWQRHRQSQNWQFRVAAWLAGIVMHHAGLATESPESFREACLSAAAQEEIREVLFVLAWWVPGAEAPAAFHREWRLGWQRRLGDGNEDIRWTAAFALLRQALEKENWGALRHVILEIWGAGARRGNGKVFGLDSAVSRFQEVRAGLAVGKVPDFEAEPTPSAERHYPRLALPPGHIAGREWKMENGELKMEN